MDEQHEEVEHIPWGELLAGADDGRRRIVYLAAGAIAALALGVVVSRTLASPSNPAPEPAPLVMESAPPATAPITVAPATAPPSAATVPAATTTMPATTTTVPAPVLYREADLVACPPDLAMRAAVARAEWFFTGSGS